MPPSSATQRLLRELKENTASPNEALLHLGPISEDDLFTWEAVLKGVKGTPYEGTPSPSLKTMLPNQRKQANPENLNRRPLVPHNPDPTNIPVIPTSHNIHNPNLAPEHLLHNRRNLSYAADRRALEPRLHALVDAERCAPASDGPEARVTVECGCCGVVARWGYSGVGECCEVFYEGGEVEGEGLS